MKQLTGGVLHSKFWVVDGRHLYLGSANMDWRSLTQVKELGAIIYNCSRLAQDLEKTFRIYWALGTPQATLPKTWPRNFSSHINRFQPFWGRFEGVPTTAYFSASPPALCPHGRTRDLDALLAVMGEAQKFIYASVMEYFPTTRFSHPARYWPVLDNALRAAAFSRGVHVRLLVSCWSNTDPTMFPYLRSLQAFSNPSASVFVDVKVFIVPVGNHSNIPFSRVNHSKFMVTEKAAYIAPGWRFCPSTLLRPVSTRPPVTNRACGNPGQSSWSAFGPTQSAMHLRLQVRMAYGARRGGWKPELGPRPRIPGRQPRAAPLEPVEGRKLVRHRPLAPERSGRCGRDLVPRSGEGLQLGREGGTELGCEPHTPSCGSTPSPGNHPGSCRGSTLTWVWLCRSHPFVTSAGSAAGLSIPWPLSPDGSG
ncbi:5'-3' exonuclease PLD4 isoform X3 [Elephas maximus indicus]|nr:5'-3' exonuclease PLD4 isoform X3 [Elephas maximus indicus]